MKSISFKQLIEPIDALGSRSEDFSSYRLSVAKKLNRTIILILGLFNLFLLIPDLTFIHSEAAKLSIIFLRAGFTVVMVALFLWINNIKTFKALSLIIMVYELLAVFIFIYVFAEYQNPDFMIQSMGVMIIILGEFIIPNRLDYMITVSILTAAGFLIYSYLILPSLNPVWFAASAVYLAITIILCAFCAHNFFKHQINEFTAKKELERVNSIDFLTNASSRIKLNEEANKWIAFCRRNAMPLSLILIDVDNLKKVNDEHGHLAGDSVLKDMTQLMYKQLRSTDVLARWGGDEFVILLPSISAENARSLAQRIQASITQFVFNSDIKVTCSFGIVDMKKDSTMEKMIHEADELMYSVKRSGKNAIKAAE